ncbi:MAG: hypothetical protein AAF593_07890 [Planctomycetota bacterium]
MKSFLSGCFLTAAVGLLLGVGDVDDVKLRYVDEKYNFSIEPPVFDQGIRAGNEEISQVVTFFDKPDLGFSPNLGIQVQPPMNLEVFDELTRAQLTGFGANNLKLEKKKSGRNDAIFYEYSAKLQGFDLRFWQLAIFTPDHTYLLTATVREDRVDKYRPEMMEAIESFRLDN